MAVLTLRIAWMSDDALITLRTVLNTAHGWGPGFNATEAVQAYTHPLWFVIWLALGTLTNQWVVGLLFLSVTLATIGFAIVVWHAASLPRIIVVSALLLFSNAFMEFSTGGLENPLAFALVGILIALSLRPIRTAAAAIAFGLCTASVVLTRFDLIVLVVPVVVLLGWHLRMQLRLVVLAALGFATPLIAWFSWSQVTYATVLPNTFEAKRNVNIPPSELVIQGMRYLWVSFEHDPVAFVVLIAGLVGALVLGPAIARAWALGASMYVGYVVWIGGDFMAGRFLAVPVYVAVFLLAVMPLQPSRRRSGEPLAYGAVAAAVSLVVLLVLGAASVGSVPVSLSATESQRWKVDQNYNAGVVDARGTSTEGQMSVRSWANQLSLAYVNPDVAPLGDSSGLARSLREINKAASNWPVSDGTFDLPSEVGEFCGGLGYLGMATGPTVHLVDNCALTDRFLAGMPFTPAEPFAWKAGHFHRDVPAGYLDAIRTGDPGRVSDMAERHRLTQLWAMIR